MPPCVPRWCIYPCICLPVYPVCGVYPVYASLCTYASLGVYQVYICLPGCVTGVYTRVLYLPGCIYPGVIPPWVYMPPSLRFVGRYPCEEGSRESSLYPFHCWPAPRSPTYCTFTTFNTERGPPAGHTGTPKCPTRFTVAIVGTLLE